jgi:ATP-dependent helicase HrpA
VDELWQGNAGGDILIFLPGEREIREAADHLRKHLSHQPVMRNAEVLPLFARLSQAEQDRIFDGHTGRASCWPPTWPRLRSRCQASDM